MKNTNFQIAVILTFLAIVFCGCQALIPAQTNTNYRNPDSLNVRLISYEEIQANPKAATNAEFIKFYKAAFPDAPITFEHIGSTNEASTNHNFLVPIVAALAVPAATAAISAVGGYISQSISNEAALYQETFSGNIQDDKFLKQTPFYTYSTISVTNADTKSVTSTIVTNTIMGYAPQYCGFEITRDVKVKPHLFSKAVNTNAFDLICGIGPTADDELFWIRPLKFSTSYAGAKLVGNWWLTKILFDYPYLVANPDNKLDSQVVINFDGYFRGTDQSLQHMPMGSFSFKVSGYDIIKQETNYWGDPKLKNGSGFLVTAPLSYSSKPNASTASTVSMPFAGNVDLTVNLTESDASNAKAELTKIGQLVANEIPQINVSVSNYLTKQLQ